MLESFQDLWPVMCGSEGLFAAIIAWRGFLALTIPLFNAQLKSKFAELIDESPNIANQIVERPWWKALALFLRMTVDIQLPNRNTMILQDVKTGGTQFITTPTETKEP